MNPTDESQKIVIDNALKPNVQQGQESAKAPEQPQQPQIQQYQQQYYPQQPYPNANYGYGANPAAYPYYNQMQQQQQQQQYQQYYQQYYGQQQQNPQFQMQQQQAYYQQYAQQYAPGYQGYYAQQAKAYGRPTVPYQGQPPLTQVNSKIQVPAKPEAAKSTNDPNYDPLLEEIKWTVLNEQRIQKKSKWSAEVVVPEDIHEYFEKKPEKKRSEYNIRNLFDEEGQAAFEIYLRKCFDKCENSKEQQLMSSMLLTAITELLQNKTIEKVSWKSYPMPILPRENEKPTALPVSALALAAANSNPLNSFTPFHIPGFNLNNAAYLVDPATANSASNATTAAGSSAPGGTSNASVPSVGNTSAITAASQIQQPQQITMQSQG